MIKWFKLSQSTFQRTMGFSQGLHLARGRVHHGKTWYQLAAAMTVLTLSWMVPDG